MLDLGPVDLGPVEIAAQDPLQTLTETQLLPLKASQPARMYHLLAAAAYQ